MATVYFFGLASVFFYYISCMVTGWPEWLWFELNTFTFRQRFKVFVFPALVISILWPLGLTIAISYKIKLMLVNYRSRH